MLLDVNCLLAIAWPNHQSHSIVRSWFEEQALTAWCTCAVTELGFIRLSSNPAFTSRCVSPPAAVQLLEKLKHFGKYSFLEAPTPCSFNEMKNGRVQGHKQVTDSYLIALAASSNVQLATLDKRLRHLPGATDHLFLID